MVAILLCAMRSVYEIECYRSNIDDSSQAVLAPLRLTYERSVALDVLLPTPHVTLRLEAGVDVYLLAAQKGTFVLTIERHYVHVEGLHADRILAGMVSMENVEAENKDS